MIKINGQSYNHSPLTKIVMGLVGIIALSVFAFLGVIAFFILGGFILLVSSVVAIRFWWLKRKLGQFNEATPRSESSNKNGTDILEGEYREIKDKES